MFELFLAQIEVLCLVFALHKANAKKTKCVLFFLLRIFLMGQKIRPYFSIKHCSDTEDVIFYIFHILKIQMLNFSYFICELCFLIIVGMMSIY